MPGTTKVTPGYGLRAWAQFLLGDDLYQVRHLVDHAADRGRIVALHNLIQPGKAQTFDHALVLYRRSDGRAHPLNANLAGGFGFGGAHPSSSTVLPRMAATNLRSRSLPSASK